MEEKNETASQFDLIYKQTTDEACKTMNSRPEGLTASEFKSFQEKYGKNIISEKKGKPIYIVFLSNFISLMAILLWAGGAIAIFADMLEYRNLAGKYH